MKTEKLEELVKLSKELFKETKPSMYKARLSRIKFQLEKLLQDIQEDENNKK